MQVGIEQSDYAGGVTRTAQYGKFSLTVSNLEPSAVAPAPVAGLTLTTNESGDLALSWTAGSGSTGSLVEMWTGNAAVKEAPADGQTYSGDSVYGLGDTLPATNHYVVYSGPGSNIAVSGLLVGTDYHIAVFAYAGAGGSTVYNHNPASGVFTAPTAPISPPLPLSAQAETRGTDVMIACTNTTPGKWYQLQWAASLESPNWKPVAMPAERAAGPTMTLVLSNGIVAPQRFYRLQEMDLPPAGRNLAAAGTPQTSYVSSWETLSAINDGYVPANSADHSHGAYGNWPQTGAQWVEYDWPLPINICMMDVYWWQDNQGIYAPASCSVQYWNGSNFVPVGNPSGLGVALNQFNTTTFDPVTTTRLRLLIQSDTAGHSTGILEWRVYDAGGSPTNFPPVVNAGEDRDVIVGGNTWLSGSAFKTTAPSSRRQLSRGANCPARAR